ncbi:MAG: hypothetical protein ACOCT0_03570 [Halobacteriota archaeon]
MKPEELLELDRRELDELFESAEPVTAGDVDGSYTGLHYAGAGPLDGALWKTASNRSPWRGMTVYGDRGTNHLGYTPVVVDAVEFTVYDGVYPGDAGPAVVFDYDVDDNPRPLGRIREYVREVDGLLLARAHFVAAGKPRFMYYFGLDEAPRLEVD